ncbi:murein biosynthesis integral membrane protein MurJ [Angustibacter luteus]|uniref:Murein biosynthesis integral membrane protein MurJ n=1 Tax=Angustibacter luteus TaxID=658456 RepID=A0ABW1J9L2_9ACTN
MSEPRSGGKNLALGIAGAATAIAALTLVTRVVGFGRWLVFSGTVGSSCVGSAYASANLVPNVLFEVVAGGALAASVVPVLSAYLVGGDRAAADRTASAMLCWAVVLLTPVALLVAVLSGPIARAMLDVAQCPGQVDSAARMLVAFSPQVVLYGVGIVLTGVLQAHRRFIGPALAPLVSSLVVIGVYLLFAAVTDRPTGPGATSWLPDRNAELLLALGTTAGVVVLSLPLLIPTWRARIRLRPTLRFDPGVARRVRRLAAAGLAGLLAQQVLVLVTLRLANSHGGTGTINVYQYVQAVYLLPYAVLAVPLATAAFPSLSSQFAGGDGPAYARTLLRSTRLVVVVSLAGAAVLVAVAPAVGGFFSALDVAGAGLSAMPVALTAFAPGLVGFALIAHLGRALFAAGHSAWAARSTVAGWLCAVVLSLVLVPALGGDGDVQATLLALGLASSLGMTVAGVALWVGAARVRVGETNAAAALRSSLPVLGAFLLVAVIALVAGRIITDRVLDPGIPGALVAGVVGSVLAGGVLVVGLAVVDREDLRTLLRRGA